MKYLLLLIPVFGMAQTRDEMLQHYNNMMRLDTVARNALFKMRIVPNWQADGAFWYSNTKADSTKEYILINPVKATRQALAAAPTTSITTSDPAAPPRWRDFFVKYLLGLEPPDRNKTNGE